jgi:putative flippase GtrA
VLAKLLNLRQELGKFFGVGLMAYLVAVGGFNLLVHLDSAPLKSKPLTASILSGALSILVAYFGNRHWTWRDRKWSGAKREITLFFIINIISLGISVICLAISRYILGFNSILADNISANIIGVGIGTIFRFWAYRTYVFKY